MREPMLELWMFVLAIAVPLIVLPAIVSWEAFRRGFALVPKHGPGPDR